MRHTTTRFAVPDIHRDRCKHAIEGAVERIPGVARARADVRGWTVTVDHFPSQAGAADILAALEGAGLSGDDAQEVF